MENKDWKIHFRSIKGHAGTWVNELANQLAKEAAAKTSPHAAAECLKVYSKAN
jgi:ribonuclease HI